MHRFELHSRALDVEQTTNTSQYEPQCFDLPDGFYLGNSAPLLAHLEPITEDTEQEERYIQSA